VIYNGSDSSDAGHIVWKSWAGHVPSEAVWAVNGQQEFLVGGQHFSK
jgi:hypothetical protein